jgi:hypothetical protein
MAIPVIKNKALCVTIPFFRVVKKPKDQTEIYPVHHIITALYPNGEIVAYTDLKYSREYRDTDFSVPVGTFRHESIRNMNRNEYTAARDKIFALYDERLNPSSANSFWTKMA